MKRNMFSAVIFTLLVSVSQLSYGLQGLGKQRSNLHSFDRRTARERNNRSYSSSRKKITHETLFSSSQNAKVNVCLYMHCSPGEKCQISANGRASCICRGHCKPTEKPLCGTDDHFYRNHCEMHRMACLTKKDIFDARHMDCFYKRTRCEKNQFNNLLDALIKIYNKSVNQEVVRDDVNRINPRDMMVNLSGDYQIQALSGFEENILTNDDREDIIKRIFKALDTDGDQLVGNKDIFQYSNMANILGSDEILFQPPCTLFHLLHFADSNRDNALNLHEFFTIFNITVLQLAREDILVKMSALQHETTAIECGIQGESHPIWKRYGRLIDANNTNHQYTVSERVLIIERINLFHAGNFSCHSRKHPELFQTIILSIFTKPIVEIYPSSINAIAGESVTIKCHATGIPFPHIQWLKNGKAFSRSENDNYLILDNGKHFHINEVSYEDSASYTCVGVNEVEQTQANMDLFVNDFTSDRGINRSVFYIFHLYGISMIEPQSCIAVETISASDSVPGLLRQNKLCGMCKTEGVRKCSWSDSVQAGQRNLYVAQPTENRLIVIDIKTRSLDEVITTDPLPSALYYHEPLDQIFVLCYMNNDPESDSAILVISVATVSGFHSAVRFPSSQSTAFKVSNLFYLPPNVYKAQLKHSFILDKEDQKIIKLNLETLEYEEEPIYLAHYNCSPSNLFYRPIGGFIDISCVNGSDNVVENLSIDYESEVLISTSDKDKLYDQEYISPTGHYVVQVNQHLKTANIFVSTYDGKLFLSLALRTNFEISDVDFREKPNDSSSTIIYFLSRRLGEALAVDVDSGEIQTMEGLEFYENSSDVFWRKNKNNLAISGWYERFIATGGANGVSLLDMDMTDISCRNHDVVEPQLIIWIDNFKEQN